MAKAAADRAVPAGDDGEKKPLPFELVAEVRPEDIEAREVTLEQFEAAVEDALQRAEAGRQSIDEAQAVIVERVQALGGSLTESERGKLASIRTQADGRLRDLKVKALESRIAGITRAQGASAGGDHYRGAAGGILAQLEAELAALRPAEATKAEESSEAKSLTAQIAKLERERDTNAGMVAGSMREKVIADYDAKIADLRAELDTARAPKAKPKGEAKAVDQQAVDDFADELERAEHQFTTHQATPDQWRAWLEQKLHAFPDGDARRTLVLDAYFQLQEQGRAVGDMARGLSEFAKREEAGPTAPEIEPARAKPSARELMSIAKIRAALYDAPPEALQRAIERAKFAESQALLEPGVTRESLIELVKTLGGREGDQPLRGPALERLAAVIGVPAAAIEGALTRQGAVLDARARDDVRRESQAGIKKVIAKGFGYVGLGMIVNRFVPGWGAATALVRMAETWKQGSVAEEQARERMVQFQQQIETGDLRDPQSLVSEHLRNIAADVALAKRDQIDQLQPATADVTDPRVLGTAMHRDTLQYLTDRHPELTPEQRKELARGTVALYMTDHATAALEAKVAAQQPEGFRKLVATIDKVLGARVLRGGETGKERALTTAVFAAAGVMAREIPIIRNILFGFTGMKIGEASASLLMRKLGKGRYESLQPVAVKDLAGETVTQDVLDRARVQLLDPELRKKSPMEYQQLREAIERHELAMLSRAEAAMDFVAARTTAMEDGLAKKQKLARERELILNSARVAGALVGSVLGPMAVEWIASKVRPEQSVAPKAAAPVEPESAETDPRMELIGTRQPNDGWVHIRARQFYAIEHPELSGDQIVAKMEAHKQMLVELRAQHGYRYAANPRHWDDRAFPLKYIELGKADAMGNGVLAEDGRTTLVSLRGEGVLPFDETGSAQLVPKGHLEFYSTKAKFGFEPIARPVAGTEISTGDVRYLDAGDTAMSEQEYQEWLAQHPDVVAHEVRAMGSGRWTRVEVLGAGDEAEVVRVPGGDVAGHTATEAAAQGLVRQGGIDFLPSYSADVRAKILEQMTHDRGVVQELEERLASWRTTYGDRLNFWKFERAVRDRILDGNDRLDRELKILSGRVSGDVTADVQRVGGFVSPGDDARIQLDALDQRLDIRTAAERSAAAMGELGRPSS